MLIIGRVQKPHGVKGYIKAQSFMDTPYEFTKIETVEIDDKAYIIEDRKISPKQVLIKLKGIDSVEAAEVLRNKQLKISREQAPEPPEGRYYINDLLGSQIYIGDSVVGVLNDIMQYGSADVYEVKGDKNFLFAYVEDVIERIDLKDKKIYLNAEALKKVAVYEN